MPTPSGAVDHNLKCMFNYWPHGAYDFDFGVIVCVCDITVHCALHGHTLQHIDGDCVS